jgi:predicted RNA-binding protein with PIN domain
MLTFVIDAFNVIHKIKELRNSHNPHHDFICFCKSRRLTGSLNNRVIIVFDGKFREDIVFHERNWKVLFSDSRSADELIVERVSQIKKAREVVVVSDDRELQSKVKASGGKIKKVDEFIKIAKKPAPKIKPASANKKNISYTLQREITEEMRRIWLKGD